MNTILKKLAITPEQYENIIWDFYEKWCESVSITPRDYQKVLANSSINAWFRMELTNCEAEFKLLINRYTDGTVSTKDLERCYRDCANKLFSLRPMALLSKIKKKPKGISVLEIINYN